MKLQSALALTITSLMLLSCSSGFMVSSQSSYSDEIYGSQNQSEQAISQQAPPLQSGELKTLNKKYAEALKVLADSSSKDTVIYKAEDSNPYTRILSDSYQESYERRLRGIEDPRYGQLNWSAKLSNDYFLAQSYDPYFYRVVLMGGYVWVEPWYVSCMFSWPTYTYYSYPFSPVGFYGTYWGYSPLFWSTGYYFNPYVNNFWYGGYTNNYNTNYFYGRRPSGNTQNSITRINNNYDTPDNPTSNQRVVSRRSGNSGTYTRISTRVTRENNTRSTTGTTRRNNNSTGTITRQNSRNTNTYGIRTRNENTRSGRTGTNQQIIRKNSTTPVSPRTRTTYFPSRSTRSIGISEPTRRSYNPVYNRKNRSIGNSSTITRRTRSASPSTVNPQRTRPATSIYNRPGRVTTPTRSSTRNTYGRTNNSGYNTTTRNGGSTYTRTTTTRSSSGSRTTNSGSNVRRR